MKRWMMNSMCAAALAALAGSASAQALKAEIPFAFRAGGVLMAPGTYDVVQDKLNASQYFRLHNRDTNQSVLLGMYTRRDPPKAWVVAGAPTLSFECAGARCVIRQIWTGYEPAFQFLGPKPAGDEPIRTAEIRLTRAAD
jgi:hypothetical protein